jgi:hypothetical protein
MKKILLSTVLLISLFTVKLPIASAEVFRINLYYDASAEILRFDKIKDAPVFYDKNKFLSPMEFINQETIGQYFLTLYDSSGNLLFTTGFDKKNGSFEISIPYFSLANSLKVFERSTNKEILSSNLSQFVTCNGNGICEFEKGETFDTCLGDCGTSAPKYSEQTKSLLEKSGGTLKDPETGALFLKSYPEAKPASEQPVTKKGLTTFNITLIIFAVILIAFAGLILYKKLRKS